MTSQNVENEQNLIRGVIYDTEPDKTYLILLEDTEESFRDWQIITGRQDAYDYIKSMVISQEYGCIDVEKSKIVVNTLTIDKAISIYEFMKEMKLKDKVIDYTEFDIDDYVTEGTE